MRSPEPAPPAASSPGDHGRVIVIGAGPAGLAVAACLKQRGIESLILEKADSVGASWRHHYDRLHLHTDRGHSALPGLPMPRNFPRYPGRLQVVEYLETYAAHFGLTPRFGAAVARARRANGGWRVDTDRDTFHTPVLVVATGMNTAPFIPHWPGAESFGGDIRHSAGYANVAPYRGKRVLVVGFGNSGGEIALDLAEAGNAVAISVRGPVNIIPRELFGLPILNWSILLGVLPPPLADRIARPLMKLRMGSLQSLGLQPAEHGALTNIRDRGRIPLIDIGTIAAIRAGRIAIRPDIKALRPGEVEFSDGRREPFDAIVAATGFRPDLRPLLPDAAEALDARGMPKVSGWATTLPGLYFCGFYASPTGAIRSIGREARVIASDIAATLPQAVIPAKAGTR
jgi:thioredoxin reductase